MGTPYGLIEMLELELKGRKGIFAEDSSTKDMLGKGFYGNKIDKKLKLGIVEALYLLDERNARCTSSGEEINFSRLSEKFWRSNKFIARYFTYRDWRDRGLVAEEPNSIKEKSFETPVKRYPSGSLIISGSLKVSGIFFKSDLMTILNEEKEGKELYERYWLGQYGSYKAADRGKFNKLDIYETLYLLNKKVLDVENIQRDELFGYAKKRRKDFESLYEVYSDWRDKGYVIKTGFKFGTHFRVYFPGAKPGAANGDEKIHSKHVIQVFPKDSKLLISEWARAVRVAHSVRKTFIMAVPGKTGRKSAKIDFVLYHRNGGEADNPKNAEPKFAMLSLGEEEYIGGSDFAAAIAEAKRKKLELLLAIVDRETSVTYYRVKQIMLGKSNNEYYEIDWFQP